jgi:signal transduction histidine kinase
MSDLVKAIKDYSHMDRGELVSYDVREGLEATLKVLNHKLKHTDIELVRDYDEELPPITARGSELNQVWTNLIDNAAMALDGKGTITLRTGRDDGCAVVEVADDGPGIAEDIRDRVFEPFFTTKGVGDGTGLGLDTARRIVVDGHDGSIAFDTGPGGTTFNVRIPIAGGAG